MENFGGNYCYKITMENFWRKYGLLWRRCTLEEIWATLEEINKIGLLWRRCTLEEIWATLEEINYIGLLWRNF